MGFVERKADLRVNRCKIFLNESVDARDGWVRAAIALPPELRENLQEGVDILFVNHSIHKQSERVLNVLEDGNLPHVDVDQTSHLKSRLQLHVRRLHQFGRVQIADTRLSSWVIVDEEKWNKSKLSPEIYKKPVKY